MPVEPNQPTRDVHSVGKVKDASVESGDEQDSAKAVDVVGRGALGKKPLAPSDAEFYAQVTVAANPELDLDPGAVEKALEDMGI